MFELPPMSSREVDPKWYDRHWYTDRPRPKRRSLTAGLVRFTVLAMLLASGGAALTLFHARGNADFAQDWEQE